MKVLCLIDNPIPPGHRWLWKYLPENDDELDFLVTTGAVDRFPKWGKLLNYYPAYLRAGFRPAQDAANTIRRGGRLGGQEWLPYALFRSIAGQKSPRWSSPPLTYGGDEPLSGPSALRAEVRLARDRLYAG